MEDIQPRPLPPAQPPPPVRNRDCCISPSHRHNLRDSHGRREGSGRSSTVMALTSSRRVGTRRHSRRSSAHRTCRSGHRRAPGRRGYRGSRGSRHPCRPGRRAIATVGVEGTFEDGLQAERASHPPTSITRRAAAASARCRCRCWCWCRRRSGPRHENKVFERRWCRRSRRGGWIDETGAGRSGRRRRGFLVRKAAAPVEQGREHSRRQRTGELLVCTWG